jgi:hypothetical protein
MVKVDARDGCEMPTPAIVNMKKRRKAGSDHLTFDIDSARSFHVLKVKPLTFASVAHLIALCERLFRHREGA